MNTKNKNGFWVIFIVMISWIGVFLNAGVSPNAQEVQQAITSPAERDFHFFVQVSGNYMLSADAKFRDIYGSGIFFPEITAGWKFMRNFYAWGGYGFFTKKGQSVILAEPSTWEQQHLSFGIGYHRDFSTSLALQVKAGAVSIRYSEEAFEEKVQDNTFGFKAGLAGIYKIGNSLYVEISIGYILASDKIGEVTVKPGGFTSSFGLGLRL